MMSQQDPVLMGSDGRQLLLSIYTNNTLLILHPQLIFNLILCNMIQNQPITGVTLMRTAMLTCTALAPT